ncbi:heme-binding protein [Methylomagnum sp.]
MKKGLFSLALGVSALALGNQTVQAACSDIARADLLTAAKAAADVKTTGGYGLPMWATFVDETGKVCAVVTNGATGEKAGNNEWLGSRVISAQKANTANAFSLDGYAISTANLYSAVSSGSLFGLQFSNPVDSGTAYLGNPKAYGTEKDPLVGRRIGGVNVFGGGLAVYSADGKTKVGAIGVSGDTSCRDHAFAWQIREALKRHPAGTGITTVNLLPDGTAAVNLAGAAKGDEMVLSGKPGDGASNYWNLWAQPFCPNSIPAATAANGTLQVQ